jgi:hypothetical protein
MRAEQRFDALPGLLRLQWSGLEIELGYERGACFKAQLPVEIALKLAHDLTEAALRAQRAGLEAVAELDAITAAKGSEPC